MYCAEFRQSGTDNGSATSRAVSFTLATAERTYLRTQAARLNVRVAPNTITAVTAVLPRGTQITFTDAMPGGFAPIITWEDGTRYMHSAYQS
jgi:phage tail protein X